ncbi:baseplate J/gp47 family protein [Salimicrobium halophilum]|uniref:Uncharacterized phage protein gp47/JayE n=1 Tax=Salimicrobium halophilum TaxID=86666 RepID=A0A1G8WCZ3_9BACI|nr:baseplate J/gp47 family protein [Salimicrobium halophilum]SDJ76114.1 Uncharacterized phage protein gp47/JayE [Salimicrobium halophilum]
MAREDEIHQEMLDGIDNSYEKVEGSFPYALTRPPAIKIAAVEKDQEAITNKLSIENLSGDELETRINDRTGLSRRPATHAIGELQVEGNGTVNQGDAFETEAGVQYEATETVTIDETGTVSIKAVEAGTIGNVPANQITQIPVTLDGINAVTNPSPTYDGFAAESDTDLLDRYYEKIRTPSTSGNRYHYINWAKEVPGVGEVRVFPLWNGDNTVKVVIIDSDRTPASPELVSDVQEEIDPGITGLGDGTAPIGAFVTVESATALTIDVSFTVTITTGFSQSDVETEVTQAITDHLYDVAFQEDYVSYAQIGALILGCESVADYTNLTVNGGTSNVSVGEQEVAVMGSVTIA